MVLVMVGDESLEETGLEPTHHATLDKLPGMESNYRLLFEQSLDAIGVEAPDGTVIDVNQAWLDLFGYSREDLPRINAIDLYATPADREHFVRRMAETGFVQDEVLYRRKDGTIFDCQRTQVSLKDESGAVVAYQGINRDVTENKRAEAALRESAEKYRTLFEQSMDAVALVAVDGTLMDANPAYLRLYGLDDGAIGHSNVRDRYVKPGDRGEFVRRMEQHGALLDEEVRLKKVDGTVMDCLRTSIAIRGETGRIVGFQSVVRDITQQKRAQERLRGSEERYRSLFDQSMDAIVTSASDGSNMDANQAWLDLFGYSRDELPGLNAVDMYPNPQDRGDFLRSIAKTGVLVDEEVRLKKKDGSVMDCARTVVARRDPEGSVVEWQGVIHDITSRKLAQQALKDSEERFRSLFEHSIDAIFLGTPGGTVIDVNQAWLNLFGYEREDLASLNAIDLYANPADRDDFLRRMAKTGFVQDEVLYKRKDGAVFDCQRTQVAFKDKHGNMVGFQGIMKDITQQKHDRAELERLARFDTLTGLLNRRAIMEKLDEWLRHVKRYKGRLSVAMLDLDHFKQVNDLHGHLVGDRVLADTASLVQRSVRLTDFVGRYGGEEFVVILPRTDIAGAQVMAERIRSLMENTAMDDGGGGTFSLTASLGVAERCAGDSVDTLINRADEPLYHAKAAGRNRVEVAACTEPSE